MPKIRPQRRVLLALTALLCACEEAPPAQELEPGLPQCARDAISSPEDAQRVALSEEITGLICPLEDQDWYSFEIPAGDGVLSLELDQRGAISPIQPTYTVWSRQADGSPGQPVAQPPVTASAPLLRQVHCLAPGPYLVQVSDRGNDEEDFRRPYRLRLDTSPDPDQAEPNGGAEAATALQPGQAATGAIACRGDEDWFKVEAAQGQLLQLSLQVPQGQWEPRLRLQDAAGQQLFEVSSLSNRVAPTELARFEVLPGPGTYYLILSDDDQQDADAEAPYTLRVELTQDMDPNEPNNHPAQATPLADEALRCGPDWGPWVEATGTLGAPGDNDWFVLPLASCRGGLLEAELELDHSALNNPGRWALARRVQATLGLVRPHRPSACAEDADCATLNAPCDEDWGCAGLFNLCLPEGLCAGAAVCLPEGVCGATQVQRSYTCDPTAPECLPEPGVTAPPNRARLSAPILTQQALWLRASDFQSNGDAPDTPYRLRARVRREADPHEPNNLYTQALDQDLGLDRQPVTDIPVHDCVPRQDDEGNPLPTDCCGADTWIEGAVGYESDLDWFRYPHPCPGEDCMLRLVYEVDAGPVDLVMNLYRGRSLWFTAFDTEELPLQAASSGSLGGLGADDRCFYAFEGHRGDPFYYHMVLRDLFALYGDPGSVRPDSRDHDPDQRYRFCVERVADGCQSPCARSEEGNCSFP